MRAQLPHAGAPQAGGAQAGGAQAGGAVVSGAPVGGAPVGGAPVGGAPVGSAPVGSAPVAAQRAGGSRAGGGRVTKRRAATRARLLDAAFRVFAAKGFGQARIDDVCLEAGYTRGAFYSNFSSLDELFFALYDERAAVIAAQVSSALSTPPIDSSVLPVIERTAATLLLDRDWLLVKTDFLLHAARNPETARRLAEHRDELRAAIQERLSAIPGIDDIPAAAHSVVAAYDGVTVQLLLDGDLPAARTWLTQLLTALLVH